MKRFSPYLETMTKKLSDDAITAFVFLKAKNMDQQIEVVSHLDFCF